MSDKFGLRTIQDPEPYNGSENLGPNTTELVNIDSIVILSFIE